MLNKSGPKDIKMKYIPFSQKKSGTQSKLAGDHIFSIFSTLMDLFLLCAKY